MTQSFMHIGRFKIASEKRSDFIDLMKDYESTASQSGLDRSHLIEDETAKGTFMHVTVWKDRADWVAVEASDAHQKMHSARNTMLTEPMQHDYVCGRIEI
ncbi:MAG: antibiotic biosynthesis monooxygenase family protein [Pseudomonadota bacterium]